MKTLKQHIADIETAEAKLQAAKTALETGFAALAADSAKHKTGDIIEIPKAACVHLGKQCRIVKVTAVRDFYSPHGFAVKYRAEVLKKDGTPALADQVSWTEKIPAD